MKLRNLKEAFRISDRNKKKHEIVAAAGGEDKGSGTGSEEDTLNLDTLNAAGVKLIHNPKTGRKIWMKDKYVDFKDMGYNYEFEGLDFTAQNLRGLIEYISYNFLRYLKKYCPEIRIPNHIKLSYDYGSGFDSTYQTITSSFRNLEQAGETTKGNVYRNLVVDTFLYMILMGHADFHRGNLIVKNKDEYYMIDPEISLQNYEKALKEGRDVMEFHIEPYFKYSKSFKKIAEQFKTIMDIDVTNEFGPIIDKCIETAIKVIVKDGKMNADEVKEEKAYLKGAFKNRILHNLQDNKAYIKKRFQKYVDAENAVPASKLKSLFSKPNKLFSR